MGLAQSTDAEEPDPWWPQATSHRRNQTVLDDEAARESVSLPGKTGPGRGDSWQCRERDLCRTVQHLAEENMRLAAARTEAEQRAARAEDHGTVAELRRHVATLTEQVENLRVAATEAEDGSQVQMLLREKVENLEEIDHLRKALASKCDAMEAIRVQLVREKDAGKALLAEAEQLKLELQNLNASTLRGSQVAAEQPSETFPAADCYDASPQEAGDRQVGSERDSRVAEEIEKFKAEMSLKREARQRAMTAISSELERLRTELASERESKQHLADQLVSVRAEKKCGHDGFEDLYKSLEGERERNSQLTVRNECLSGELDSSERSLTAKTEELEELRKNFDLEREQYQRKVSSLKEVVSISKQLLSIREKQVDDLESKLKSLQGSLCSRRDPSEEQEGSACSQVEAGLKEEYQAQLENIKSLKALYDERMKIILEEKDKLAVEFEETRVKLEAEQKKCGELDAEVTSLKLSLSEQEDAMSDMQTQLDMSKDEARDLARELALINNLFTQMLVNNNGSDIDLDKLTKSLQENHDLISEITLKEDGSEIAACLPKLLLELVAEVDKSAQSSCEAEGGNTVEETVEDDNKDSKQRPCTSCQENNIADECSHNIAAEDIASNLPKVWKVLTELLSHHVTPSERPSDSNDDCCYKRVDTPYGPRLAISVSKTFLRLKDLILEKKSLRRELVQLKQLNCHLENRLSEQEQRLSLVSSELHKTWSVVGRMRTQHQQLHNHEKILRYELQQKRKLLTELKQELEYCRETWEMAREKNSQSEEQWQTLRREFASRKKGSSGSLDNSGESGFSDDKEDDSSGEDGRSPGGLGPSESSLPGADRASSTRSESALVEPQVLPPLVVDVSHEQFLPEEVCPLKSPPTPELLESSARVTVHDDSAVDTAVLVECPVEKYCGLECSTISLISLLKQQLSCFSRNLEEITSDLGGGDGNNHQALQSIFFLPDIKVPYYEQSSDISQIKCANCSKGLSAIEVDSGETHCDTPAKKKQCSYVLSNEPGPNDESTNNWKNVPKSSSSSSVVDCQVSSSQNGEHSSLEGCEMPVEETAGQCRADGAVQENRTVVDRLGRTPEQVLQAREARLRRLEEQCEQLVRKVTSTSNRSVVLSSRLEELHEQYGGAPEPPPMPGAIPALRIPETPTSAAPAPPPMPGAIPTLRIPTTGQSDLSSQSTNSEDTVLSSHSRSNR
ncbi:protein Daple [Bacillus rossius redtenbacheri]|uniref:protein Daple n=1 Tax=Bacillus rossius redtenbacheri TaxID=93214 RepID=UPI002FDD52B4